MIPVSYILIVIYKYYSDDIRNEVGKSCPQSRMWTDPAKPGWTANIADTMRCVSPASENLRSRTCESGKNDVEATGTASETCGKQQWFFAVRRRVV